MVADRLYTRSIFRRDLRGEPFPFVEDGADQFGDPISDPAAYEAILAPALLCELGFDRELDLRSAVEGTDGFSILVRARSRSDSEMISTDLPRQIVMKTTIAADRDQFSGVAEIACRPTARRTQAQPSESRRRSRRGRLSAGGSGDGGWVLAGTRPRLRKAPSPQV